MTPATPVTPEKQTQSGTSAAQPLGFAELYEKALQNALELQRVALAEQRAGLERDLVETQDDASLVVSGSAGARASYLPEEPRGSTDRGDATFTEGRAQGGLDQSAAVRLSKILYDWGRQDARLKVANAALQVERLKADEIAFTLRYRVARAYQQFQSAVASAQLTSELLANAKAKLAQVERNYRNGLRPESDLVRAQADVGRNQLNVQRANDALALSRTNLALFLFPAEAASGTSGAARPPVDFRPAVRMKSGADWARTSQGLGSGLRDVPTQKRRAAEKDRLETEVLVIDADEKPELRGSVGPQVSGALTPVTPTLSGELTFSWNIPWTREAELQRARVSVLRKDLDIQDQIDLRQRAERATLAGETLAVLLSELDSVSEQIALQQKLQALTRRRYETGRASALELSETEDGVIDARLDRLVIENRIASTLIDLAEARGVPDIAKLFE